MLIVYISGGIYSLKSTPNDGFFEKIFMAILFDAQSLCQKSAEYFSYFVLMSGLSEDRRLLIAASMGELFLSLTNFSVTLSSVCVSCGVGLFKPKIIRVCDEDNKSAEAIPGVSRELWLLILNAMLKFFRGKEFRWTLRDIEAKFTGFVLCCPPEAIPGFSSNKPTHYLLDHGGFTNIVL